MKYLFGLIGFVKPLKFQMLIAVLCGTAGHILAISIPVLGITAVLSALGFYDFNINNIFAALCVASVFRGIFAYCEQQRNHYIAFTILAIIRDKVFAALRKLAPAKLDGKNRGNLISIITSDIELLEVFFAHTISPIIIATLVSLAVAVFLGSFSIIFAIISLLAHLTLGFILPAIGIGKNQDIYTSYRNQNGELSSYYLDSLRGIDEVLQLENGQARLSEISEKTKDLEYIQIKKATLEGSNNGTSEILVYFFGAAMLLASSITQTSVENILLPTVVMMSSFGPVLSLSKLTVGLGGTVASAKRVLTLLNEQPEVTEVENGKTPDFSHVKITDLSFSYGDNTVLKNINAEIQDKKITSVIGKSGSGKSTLVKLIMRFWNSDGIKISDENLTEIDTQHLKKIQSYMTQDSDIFSSTILENIRIGDLTASDKQVIEAAKKASLHDFVLSLENGYNTPVGELGDTLSGGEKQRIGLARAFLHNGDLLVLDEPTSNLDSLNESIILKSIKEHNKATILISHRKSTLGISHISYEIENGVVV